jgi:hypothetical protein
MESEANRYVAPPATRVTTMVGKLPQFIKAAKNREAVLKAVKRMLKK